MNQTLTPIQAMQLAILEAKKGEGFVSPNPLVGCVILDRSGKVIGQGHHAKVGGPHAEMAALQTVKDPRLLDQAEVYVTLEPCAHQGRTPPCADHLATLPLKKVVYGLVDPNPKVAGRGVQKIKTAGLQIESMNEMREELEDLAEIFLFNQKKLKAFTAIKVATTLDGQMAQISGHSQWITGESARQQVHCLRGAYDAVAVGRRTFEIDNPKLNIRHERYAQKRNKVFILDPEGRAISKLKESQLLQHHDPSDIIWVTKMACTMPPGVQNWVTTFSSQSGFDWNELTSRAYAEGICSILVEGGAGMIGRLLQSSAAQRWYQFIAPDLMGAQQGLSVGWGWGFTLDQRQKLFSTSWQSFGRDLLLSGRLPQVEI